MSASDHDLANVAQAVYFAVQSGDAAEAVKRLRDLVTPQAVSAGASPDTTREAVERLVTDITNDAAEWDNIATAFGESVPSDRATAARQASATLTALLERCEKAEANAKAFELLADSEGGKEARKRDASGPANTGGEAK